MFIVMLVDTERVIHLPNNTTVPSIKGIFPFLFLNGDAASDVHLLQMQEQQSRRAGLCLAPSTGHTCYRCDLFDGISVCRNQHLWWLQWLMEFNLAFIFLRNGLVTRS